MPAIPTREEVFGKAAGAPLTPGRFVPSARASTPQPLTRVQAGVLLFIARHILTWQRPPTMRAIAVEFGWASENAALGHVHALERRGWIALDHVSAGGRGKSVPRVLHWPDDGALGRASSGEAQAADSPVQGSAGRAHDQSRFFNR